jgi:hypothetical protein
LEPIFSVLSAIAIFVANLFKSRRRLEVENLLLRHQLNIVLRRAPARQCLYGIDRAILTGLIRLWPELNGVVQVVKPDTILRWHDGFSSLLALEVAQAGRAAEG